MRASRRRWGIGLAALWMLWSAPAAFAADANTIPPHVILIAAGSEGSEGVIGPKAPILARFETEAPDQTWSYRPDSEVTFKCSVDGQPVPCSAVYRGCCKSPVAVEPPAGGMASVAEPPSYGFGPYSGSVPVPGGLSGGPHVVTVIAADEDGADPAPPSVVVILDRQPPSAPELTQVPSRRGWERKPIFRYSASDDFRLVARSEQPFRAALRRLDPPGFVYREEPFGSYLSTWFPRCPTLLTCSDRSQASYTASEHWYSYGEPERLVAGLYEFRVRARDAVGNKSPLTAYRFRILPGKPR